MFKTNELDFEIDLRQWCINMASKTVERQNLISIATAEEPIGNLILGLAEQYRQNIKAVMLDDCKATRELRDSYFRYVLECQKRDEAEDKANQAVDGETVQ